MNELPPVKINKIEDVIGPGIWVKAFVVAMAAHDFYLDGRDLVHHITGIRLRGDLKTVAGAARLVQETENLYIVTR